MLEFLQLNIKGGQCGTVQGTELSCCRCVENQPEGKTRLAPTGTLQEPGDQIILIDAGKREPCLLPCQNQTIYVNTFRLTYPALSVRAGLPRLPLDCGTQRASNSCSRRWAFPNSHLGSHVLFQQALYSNPLSVSHSCSSIAAVRNWDWELSCSIGSWSSSSITSRSSDAGSGKYKKGQRGSRYLGCSQSRSTNRK